MKAHNNVLLFTLSLALTAGAQTKTTIPAQAVLSDDSSATAVEPASIVPDKNKPPVAFRRDGLWFSTHDGATQLHVHGYAQADDRMFSDTIHGEELDTFLFRRIRPLFEGTLFNAVDFRFMPDFGQSTYQIQEAFLELKSVKFAKLRVGKFKEPIGLEVLRSDRDLTFAERSLASDLVPLRYIGAQLSGSVLSDSISYAAGYFNGSSDGSNGAFTQWTHGNEAAARLFLRPFATTRVNALHQFGIGLGDFRRTSARNHRRTEDYGTNHILQIFLDRSREWPAQSPRASSLLLCRPFRRAQ